MDSGKFSELITQVFSRFLISGIVFYLFIICLPSFWLLGVTGNFIVNNFTFIFLVSLVVGLLLDISKFYRILWWFITLTDKNLKKELERAIVKAFKIEVEEKDDDNYGKQILNISTRIQDTYIRVNHPDVFHRIDNARIYPDIISMALFCVAVFLIVCLCFFFIILNSPNTLLSVHIPANVSLVLLPGSMLLSIITIWKGIGKVKRKYRILNDFTKCIIGEGYYRSDDESKNRFLQTLKEANLIVFDKNKKIWKVLEEGES